MNLPPLQNFAPALPPAQEFVAVIKQRSRWISLLAFLLALLCGGCYVVMGLDNMILPLVVLILLAIPIIVWNYTRAAFYIIFAATCLIEVATAPYPDSLTDRVPFFVNINTLFQVYAHADVKAMPFSCMEVLLMLAGATSLVRAVVMDRVSLRGGKVFVPILAYIGFVVVGFINGMLTGGDYKLALQETRPQFHLFIAYLMGVNLITDRKQVRTLMWMTVLCIGLKGILYTFRRYVTIGAALPVPDQGVGSHEEAFLFDAFVVLLTSLSFAKVQNKLRTLMWLLLPTVILGNLATNRRAATAAMIVIIPVIFLASYRVFPRRRRAIALTAAILAVGWSIYYPAFKNSNSMLGQPARSVKSQFEPDARDAASNAYRDAENTCQMTTMRTSPIIGYGYGKRFIHAVPIADISRTYEWWDLLPHNQVLWVWMRIGTLGFFTFWFMICSILIYLCRIIRSRYADPEVIALGIFTLATVSMLMIFGLLDLQLSNTRDALFVGFWVGIMASLDRQNNLTARAMETLESEAASLPQAPVTV